MNKNNDTEVLERFEQLNKKQLLDRVSQMDPLAFERLTALVFRHRGYEAETVGRSGDEGVDVRLRKNGQTAVAQCKRYADNIGQPVIRDLYGTMLHNGASEAFLVTTAQFTPQAKQWAINKPIHFIDGFTFVDWVEDAAAASGDRRRKAAEPQAMHGRSAIEGRSSSRMGRWWYWPLGALALLFFGVAVGIAYNRLSNRWVDNTANEPNVVISTPLASSGPTIASHAESEQHKDEATTETTSQAPATDSEQATFTASPSTPTHIVNTSSPPATWTLSPETDSPETDSSLETAVPTSTTEPTVHTEPTAIVANSPTNTSIPTALPTPTWTPVVAQNVIACDVAVDAEFESLYDAATLGCPTSPTGLQWAAYEPFEHGYLLWRSDTDAAYAFFGHTTGTWTEIEERWDGSSTAPRGEPPDDKFVPERGFGYIWGIRDDLFNGLGWATETEKGFCAFIQPFEQGFILQSIAVDTCTADNLFNHARTTTWRPLTIIAAGAGMFELK